MKRRDQQEKAMCWSLHPRGPETLVLRIVREELPTLALIRATKMQ